MKRLKLFIFGLLAVILFSCNNEEKAIYRMCFEIQLYYPHATLQDVYKTCYQDYFGAEHLMTDTAAAREYLHLELEQCRDTDLSKTPRREHTGFRHRFARLYLICVLDGEITEEQLLTMFIEAAEKNIAYSNEWASEWEKIEKIALEANPLWADEALQAELREAAQGNLPVRHSEAFRQYYNPHYRIVRK